MSNASHHNTSNGGPAYPPFGGPGGFGAPTLPPPAFPGSGGGATGHLNGMMNPMMMAAFQQQQQQQQQQAAAAAAMAANPLLQQQQQQQQLLLAQQQALIYQQMMAAAGMGMGAMPGFGGGAGGAAGAIGLGGGGAGLLPPTTGAPLSGAGGPPSGNTNNNGFGGQQQQRNSNPNNNNNRNNNNNIAANNIYGSRPQQQVHQQQQQQQQNRPPPPSGNNNSNGYALPAPPMPPQSVAFNPFSPPPPPPLNHFGGGSGGGGNNKNHGNSSSSVNNYHNNNNNSHSSAGGGTGKGAAPRYQQHQQQGSGALPPPPFPSDSSVPPSAPNTTMSAAAPVAAGEQPQQQSGNGSTAPKQQQSFADGSNVTPLHQQCQQPKGPKPLPPQLVTATLLTHTAETSARRKIVKPMAPAVHPRMTDAQKAFWQQYVLYVPFNFTEALEYHPLSTTMVPSKSTLLHQTSVAGLSHDVAATAAAAAAEEAAAAAAASIEAEAATATASSSLPPASIDVPTAGLSPATLSAKATTPGLSPAGGATTATAASSFGPCRRMRKPVQAKVVGVWPAFSMECDLLKYAEWERFIAVKQMQQRSKNMQMSSSRHRASMLSGAAMHHNKTAGTDAAAVDAVCYGQPRPLKGPRTAAAAAGGGANRANSQSTVTTPAVGPATPTTTAGAGAAGGASPLLSDLGETFAAGAVAGAGAGAGGSGEDDGLVSTPRKKDGAAAASATSPSAAARRTASGKATPLLYSTAAGVANSVGGANSGMMQLGGTQSLAGSGNSAGGGGLVLSPGVAAAAGGSPTPKDDALLLPAPTPNPLLPSIVLQFLGWYGLRGKEDVMTTVLAHLDDLNLLDNGGTPKLMTSAATFHDAAALAALGISTGSHAEGAVSESPTTAAAVRGASGGLSSSQNNKIPLPPQQQQAFDELPTAVHAFNTMKTAASHPCTPSALSAAGRPQLTPKTPFAPASGTLNRSPSTTSTATAMNTPYTVAMRQLTPTTASYLALYTGTASAAAAAAAAGGAKNFLAGGTMGASAATATAANANANGVEVRQSSFSSNALPAAGAAQQQALEIAIPPTPHFRRNTTGFGGVGGVPVGAERTAIIANRAVAITANTPVVADIALDDCVDPKVLEETQKASVQLFIEEVLKAAREGCDAMGPRGFYHLNIAGMTRLAANPIRDEFEALVKEFGMNEEEVEAYLVADAAKERAEREERRAARALRRMQKRRNGTIATGGAPKIAEDETNDQQQEADVGDKVCEDDDDSSESDADDDTEDVLNDSSPASISTLGGFVDEVEVLRRHRSSARTLAKLAQQPETLVMLNVPIVCTALGTVRNHGDNVHRPLDPVAHYIPYSTSAQKTAAARDAKLLAAMAAAANNPEAAIGTMRTRHQQLLIQEQQQKKREILLLRRGGETEVPVMPTSAHLPFLPMTAGGGSDSKATDADEQSPTSTTDDGATPTDAARQTTESPTTATGAGAPPSAFTPAASATDEAAVAVVAETAVADAAPESDPATNPFHPYSRDDVITIAHLKMQNMPFEREEVFVSDLNDMFNAVLVATMLFDGDVLAAEKAMREKAEALEAEKQQQNGGGAVAGSDTAAAQISGPPAAIDKDPKNMSMSTLLVSTTQSLLPVNHPSAWSMLPAMTLLNKTAIKIGGAGNPNASISALDAATALPHKNGMSLVKSSSAATASTASPNASQQLVVAQLTPSQVTCVMIPRLAGQIMFVAFCEETTKKTKRITEYGFSLSFLKKAMWDETTFLAKTRGPSFDDPPKRITSAQWHPFPTPLKPEAAFDPTLAALAEDPVPPAAGGAIGGSSTNKGGSHGSLPHLHPNGGGKSGSSGGGHLLPPPPTPCGTNTDPVFEPIPPPKGLMNYGSKEFAERVAPQLQQILRCDPNDLWMYTSALTMFKLLKERPVIMDRKGFRFAASGSEQRMLKYCTSFDLFKDHQDRHQRTDGLPSNPLRVKSCHLLCPASGVSMPVERIITSLINSIDAADLAAYQQKVQQQQNAIFAHQQQQMHAAGALAQQAAQAVAQRNGLLPQQQRQMPPPPLAPAPTGVAPPNPFSHAQPQLQQQGNTRRSPSVSTDGTPAANVNSGAPLAANPFSLYGMAMPTVSSAGAGLLDAPMPLPSAAAAPQYRSPQQNVSAPPLSLPPPPAMGAAVPPPPLSLEQQSLRTNVIAGVLARPVLVLPLDIVRRVDEGSLYAAIRPASPSAGPFTEEYPREARIGAHLGFAPNAIGRTSRIYVSPDSFTPTHRELMQQLRAAHFNETMDAAVRAAVSAAAATGADFMAAVTTAIATAFVDNDSYLDVVWCGNRPLKMVMSRVLEVEAYMQRAAKWQREQQNRQQQQQQPSTIANTAVAGANKNNPPVSYFSGMNITPPVSGPGGPGSAGLNFAAAAFVPGSGLFPAAASGSPSVAAAAAGPPKAIDDDDDDKLSCDGDEVFRAGMGSALSPNNNSNGSNAPSKTSPQQNPNAAAANPNSFALGIMDRGDAGPVGSGGATAAGISSSTGAPAKADDDYEPVDYLETLMQQVGTQNAANAAAAAAAAHPLPLPPTATASSVPATSPHSSAKSQPPLVPVDPSVLGLGGSAAAGGMLGMGGFNGLGLLGGAGAAGLGGLGVGSLGGGLGALAGSGGGGGDATTAAINLQLAQVQSQFQQNALLLQQQSQMQQQQMLAAYSQLQQHMLASGGNTTPQQMMQMAALQQQLLMLQQQQQQQQQQMATWAAAMGGGGGGAAGGTPPVSGAGLGGIGAGGLGGMNPSLLGAGGLGFGGGLLGGAGGVPGLGGLGGLGAAGMGGLPPLGGLGAGGMLPAPGLFPPPQ